MVKEIKTKRTLVTMSSLSKKEKSRHRLFGTDGIRGTANQFPMTSDIILKVGQALGYLLKQKSQNTAIHKVVIGKDTRLSGYMLEQALSSGLNSMGVYVQLVGPLPTPGIGFLAQNMRASAGIVISASHNAYRDNGVKIFGADGFKIPDQMEREIERLVFDVDLNSLLPTGEGLGRSRRIDDSAGRYIVYVKNTFPNSYTLEGLRVVLDCANGAAYKVAPAVFEELGAELIVLANEPNGYNINDKSGALYPSKVSDAVLKYRADIGISLDGDGDRVIMADEKGHLINGDHVLAICSLHLKHKGELSHNTIVTTQMSNFGLDKLMKSHGIEIIKTDVGDKNVVEEMRKGGYILGGEQSGHIIFMNHSTTGDGLIAALKIMAVMKEQGKKLSELAELLVDIPQVLISTRIQEKKPFQEIPGYEVLINKFQKELNESGRILVRYSGTEPVVRILVEGLDKRHISGIAEEVASFLSQRLG